MAASEEAVQEKLAEATGNLEAANSAEVAETEAKGKERELEVTEVPANADAEELALTGRDTLLFASSGPSCASPTSDLDIGSTPPKVDGSLIKVRRQDPSVDMGGLEVATVRLPGRYAELKTSDVKVSGIGRVASDSNGDFLRTPSDGYIFEVQSVFGIVSNVLAMYRRAMQQVYPNGPGLNWQWGDVSPIKVYPFAGVQPNAYYSRNERALKFFYFQHQRTGKLVLTCASPDVAAHEAGHAILDGICPGYFASSHPQTGGLHEAFGDITNIFYLLSDPAVCDYVIEKSDGDLHKVDLFLSEMAEEFGAALGRSNGLRNADNDLTLSQVSTQVHDISKVFTGAVYDVLVRMFNDAADPATSRLGVTLFHEAAYLRSLLVGSLLNGPQVNATFADIAEGMSDLTSSDRVKAIIAHEFGRREVFAPAHRAMPANAGEHTFNKCCHTLQHEDCAKLRAEALAALVAAEVAPEDVVADPPVEEEVLAAAASELPEGAEERPKTPTPV